jgi:hypothetical protein
MIGFSIYDKDVILIIKFYKIWFNNFFNFRLKYFNIRKVRKRLTLSFSKIMIRKEEITEIKIEFCKGWNLKTILSFRKRKTQNLFFKKFSSYLVWYRQTKKMNRVQLFVIKM